MLEKVYLTTLNYSYCSFDPSKILAHFMVNFDSFLLDYSIRGSLAPSISPSFMVALTEEVLSSMVLEPRSWVQFPPATQFSAARIPPSLASAGPAGTAAPEREQTAPIAAART
jgi:hypothetical protein